MREAAAQHVVYVHGLWMPGSESLLLAHRLQREFGLQVHAFPYSAGTWGMEEITAHLQSFVRGLDVAAVHFVGHSLGGLVIYRFLEHYPEQPAGRVVFLGTPCLESRAAVQAAQLRFVGALMGPSVAAELLQPRERRWSFRRALGIIAGTQSIGLGQFLAGFEEECDGTVAVSETRLPGAADHITLPVSHMGMLVSPRVAQETGLFLANGRFSLR
ncbi:MAG: esterase/lipase family protein [Steroidobacteraceae bacterium]